MGKQSITFEDAYRRLLALPKWDKKGADAFNSGQERVLLLLDRMGNPQESFPSVHVAGTNGKGSTSSMLAAILTAAGRKTGLHTSPHLFSVNERMRVGGVPAPEDWFAQAVEQFGAAIDDIKPSFFEATTAISFLYFAERDVDIAVVEVGLGGRLDATNVLRTQCCLITSIGFDHTKLLGRTLEEIATEKAGILRKGVPAITSNSDEPVISVLAARAAERGAPFLTTRDYFDSVGLTSSDGALLLNTQSARRHYRDVSIGLRGTHQAENALLAIAGAEVCGDISEKDIRRGLGEVMALSGVRGRLQVVASAPWIVADVSHNADSVQAAVDYVRSLPNASRNVSVAFGIMREKDLGPMIEILSQCVSRVYPVQLDSDRALPAQKLAEAFRVVGIRAENPAFLPDILAAFRHEASPTDVLLVAGSHQVVAQLPENLRDRSEWH